MSDSIDEPRLPSKAPVPDGSTTSQFTPLGEDALFSQGTDAIDDAPTIISRGSVRPPRPESFAQTLRGRRLSHFDLIEPIGVGGMAAVIRAQDTQLDRPVALKILPPDMASDPEIIRRFQQEARAAARLDHENIARVFFYGSDQGLHFIAFEFVEGDNLRAVLERRGRLPVPEAVHYVLQIAAGLAHATERGVVHRDIKPSNIIIGPTGRAKLVDMGLARSLLPAGDAELTQSGVTLGTFDYISPEQALEPRSADARSDVYSLGCTFYQALTGQAPVPDGTAAKKLHHHQHVPPLDPRQLNSAIPDDLAAILGRMMAKDPDQRYQRPEHLVQHLLQLAQKLGTGSSGPDGVLFVDAPLPAPPRLRPLFVALAAGFLLLMVVTFHGMSSWSAPKSSGGNPIPRPAGPPSNPTPLVEKDRGTPREPVAVQPDAPPTPTPLLVGSAAELAEVVANNSGNLDVALRGDLDLVKASEPGARAPEIVFGPGREFTIKPKDWDVGRNPRKRVTLRLTYNADLRPGESEGAWIPLTIKGCHVTIKGVRFEVDAREAPQLLIAPLRVQDGGSLTLESCEFVQLRPPATGRQADVYVEGATGRQPKPSITARECSFVSAARARTPEVVSLSGAAIVTMTNCAFGPHAALVHLRGKGTQPAEVRLYNCSALLADGAAFLLDEDLSARLSVTHSLFSHPTSADAAAGSVALIRQDGDGTVQTYEGRGNRYHNLTTFWARSPDQSPVADDWEGFRNHRHVVNDPDSETVDVAPWTAKDPLAALEKGQVREAFQVDARSPEVRLPGGKRLVGVEVCTWGRSYESLPPLEERRHQLVVDPTQSGGDDAFTKYYSKLELAVLDAKPGDVILIRKTGELSVEPMRLEKSSVDLTIRPYRGYHPLLTLGDVSDKDVALFRVQDGKLKLEDLEFHLRPRQRDSKEAQAVAGVAGQGHCSFKRCVFTLDAEGNEGATLSVVTLADPSNVMKMGPAPTRPMPELFFENCFARGRGSILTVRASRPFDLRADNCLAALVGSFCVIEGGNPREPKDPPMTPAQITLTHVTAVLTGNLLLLHTARDTKDLVPVQAHVSDCVFSAASGQPLVHFDGEVSQVTKRTLDWTGGKRNVYHNFKQLLDQSKGEENMMSAFNDKKWVGFTGEDDPVFEGMHFVTPAPASDRAFLDVGPGRFRMKLDDDADVRGGANPARLLTPLAKGRLVPATTPDE